MFDLDQAIVNWRRQLTVGGIKSPAVLDELENHLREDVEQRLRSTRSIQQAFESAIKQLGEPEALRREFAQANGASRFQGWSWLVALCFAFPILCLGRRAIVLIKLFGFWYWGWTPTERLLGSAAVVALLLAVCSWLFSHRILPVIANGRKRIALLIACSLAAPLWYAFVPDLVLSLLPGNRELDRFLVTMLWLMVPCAILPGVVYGLERAARRAVTSGS